jgi:hypothetical protein
MTFIARSTDDGVHIGFEQRGMLRRARSIPPAEWRGLAGAHKRAANMLLAMVEEGQAAMHPGEGGGPPDGVVIPHATAVALPASIGEAIGLPPLASLSVTLSFEGKMTDADGHIRCRWYDESSQTVRVVRKGCMVFRGGREGRLSATLYRLIEAVDAYNRTDGQPPEPRIEAWLPVQESYHAITGEEARSDDAYLAHLTIYQAGAMALDIRQTADGPDFSPIVMRRERRANQTDDEAPVPEENGDPASLGHPKREVADALLPRNLQSAFQERFKGEAKTRQAYVLGRQEYLVVDPELRTALDVVRRKRLAPRAEREEFIRNPRPAIAAALGRVKGDPQTGTDRFDAPDEDTVAANLLVETHEYAERVIGLGVWEKPKLPWLKTPAGQWMPERFPVSIGPATIMMGRHEADQIKAAHAVAAASGQIEMIVEGQVLPTADVERALHSLGLLEAEAERPGTFAETPTPYHVSPETEGEAPHEPSQQPADGEAGTGPATEIGADRQVLLIRQNFDGVEYLMSHSRRLARIPADFPGNTIARSTPKPHQVEGFRWLAETWQAGWPGVLLADDMGLGKTFQALAFLAWVRKNRVLTGMARHPVLVVAPTALLRNWIDEAERHLEPDALGERLDVFGSALLRLKTTASDGWSEADSLDVARLRDTDWMLTTYETLANHHRAFARVAFSVVLFDEAQKIKNPGAINTQAAKAMNADFTLAMTGTPIENRLADIWCIMDRAVPGYLGELKGFVARYEDGGQPAMDALKSKLDRPDTHTPAPMLRRMKSDILVGLPQKRQETLYAQMPPAQASAYAKVRLAAQEGGRGNGDMLRAIHAFRGISLHPDGADGVDPFDEASIETWIGRSARLTQTVCVLEAIAGRGEKALVFLEDLAIQKVFANAMATRFRLAAAPAVINGGVAGEKRLAIVDAFQRSRDGFGLLVLSPKAAGVGLTITAANHVVHLSRWWNPAIEDQCNDRCYRIGQVRPVTIHVPLAIHPAFGEASFDLTLHRLLERKRALSRHMLMPPVEEGDVEALFEKAVGGQGF